MLPSLTVGLFLPQPTKPGNPTAAVRFKNPFSSWHTDRATEAGGDHMVGSREGPGPGFHYRTLSYTACTGNSSFYYSTLQCSTIKNSKIQAKAFVSQSNNEGRKR
ncbi:hypothetical protein V6N11_010768 [Hibiscus sabdariffa]|uniref:Uncharacterized protein n=1 Tax=Hibiscus sabdariffa TaxID=183260 RepID=A0ABR2S6V9_9ROSI